MKPSAPRRRRAALLAPVALLAALVGCTDDDPAVEITPDAAAVVAGSAQTMARTAAAHVVLTVDPPVGGLPVVRNEGDIGSSGDATGTIQFRQGNQLLEVGYRQSAGGEAFLRWPASPEWLPAGPVIGVYDPSAMLDPARGVARLLSTATGGRVEGAEQVDGVPAWRVAVALDRGAVDTFVPGVSDGVTAQLWVDQATGRLLRLEARVPEPAATITLTLTNFDVSVSVPQP